MLYIYQAILVQTARQNNTARTAKGALFTRVEKIPFSVLTILDHSGLKLSQSLLHIFFWICFMEPRNRMLTQDKKYMAISYKFICKRNIHDKHISNSTTCNTQFLALRKYRNMLDNSSPLTHFYNCLWIHFIVDFWKIGSLDLKGWHGYYCIWSLVGLYMYIPS